MRTIHLPIAEPCHEDWDAMDPEGRRRFCRVCDKHVHDLSAMTEREAREVLAEGCRDGRRLCVRYAHDDDGHIVFQPETCAAPRPISTALRTAAAAVLLAACTPHERGRPRQVVGQLAAAPPVQHTVEMGEVAIVDPPPEPCDPPPRATKGEAPPEVVMGKMPAPPRARVGRVAPDPERVLMGDVAAPEPAPKTD